KTMSRKKEQELVVPNLPVNQNAKIIQEEEAVTHAPKPTNTLSAGAQELLMNVGRVQALGFIRKTVTVTEIKFLDEIVNSKAYKELTIERGGKSVTVTDLEQFCKHFLEYSYEKLRKDLGNYRLLQEDYDHAKAMGLGYRDFDMLRKLDGEERVEVLENEAFKQGDLEEIRKLVKGMAEDHVHEKAELKEQHKRQVEDKEQVIRKHEEKIEHGKKALKKEQEETEKLTEQLFTYRSEGADATEAGQLRELDALCNKTFSSIKELMHFAERIHGDSGKGRMLDPPQHLVDGIVSKIDNLQTYMDSILKRYMLAESATPSTQFDPNSVPLGKGVFDFDVPGFVQAVKAAIRKKENKVKKHGPLKLVFINDAFEAYVRNENNGPLADSEFKRRLACAHKDDKIVLTEQTTNGFGTLEDREKSKIETDEMIVHFICTQPADGENSEK
ncbi:MAG: hypothetical protein GY862_32685, partial [Gammaproteobacteria bacterium]|nr:hypothetical protein [Gammaproteobacteria bacterium]